MSSEVKRAHVVSLRICEMDPKQKIQCLKIGPPLSPDLALNMARSAIDTVTPQKLPSFIEEEGFPATEGFPLCHECRAQGVIFQRIDRNTPENGRALVGEEG